MIYIVEDDRNIQEIELFALKNSGYQATGFETAKEFYKALNEKLPELILLDIMLPDEDGLSILKRLRTRADTQKIPVILVTAKTSEIDKVKGLDGGADDYIAKPFGVMEMIARVKALLRRSGGMEESLLTCGNVTLDGEKRMVYVDGKSIELTYKEFELLKLLMKNHGIVISRDVIMERVWDSTLRGRKPHHRRACANAQAEARRRRRAHQDHPQRRLYGGRSEIKRQNEKEDFQILCLHDCGGDCRNDCPAVMGQLRHVQKPRHGRSANLRARIFAHPSRRRGDRGRGISCAAHEGRIARNAHPSGRKRVL